jgi:multidrug transporter EmrE-like cation transporter
MDFDRWAFLMIVVLSFFWAIGDIIYKQAVTISGKIDFGTLWNLITSGFGDMIHFKWTANAKIVLMMIISFSIALCCTILLSIPLSRMEVSIVKPILNTVTIVWITILSVIILKESMTWTKGIGIALAAVAIWFLML